MDELQRHLDAFEIYFQKKQEGCTIPEAVAGVNLELGWSESSIYDWKKKFNWDDREAIRSSEINKEVQRRTDSNIIDNKTKYLTYYHKLLDKLKKNGFDIEIKSPRDLDLIIKGALLLQGEPTNIEKSEVEAKVKAEDPSKEFNRIMDNALENVDQAKEEK